MLDFLFDASYWNDTIAIMVCAYQAGVNMIPNLGWQQAVESWAASKVTK